MSLDDPKVDRLTGLIKDSFRVRPNQDPVYVDTGGHIDRLSAKQHQVIFGRRGSGKSCLLVHYARARATREDVLAIYVDADEVKTLPYPDLLIRLLLQLGEALDKASSPWIQRLLRRRSSRLAAELDVLRSLLDEALVARVASEVSANSGASGALQVGPSTSNVSVGVSEGESERVTTGFIARKVDTLERHLKDYKDHFPMQSSGHASVTSP
jgi:hypothetical protein